MIGVERDDGVAVVTIDRPDALNALDQPTLTELRDRLARARGRRGGPRRRAHGRGRAGVRRRRRHQGHERRWTSSEAPRLGRARPRGRRGCSRRCRSRRSRRSTGSRSAAAASSRSRATSATRRPAAKLGQPEVVDRDHPRLGRHAAAARASSGIGVAKELIFTGRHRRRRGGAAHRARQRRLRARRADGEGARARAVARGEEPARARRGEGRRTRRCRATSTATSTRKPRRSPSCSRARIRRRAWPPSSRSASRVSPAASRRRLGERPRAPALEGQRAAAGRRPRASPHVGSVSTSDLSSPARSGRRLGADDSCRLRGRPAPRPRRASSERAAHLASAVPAGIRAELRHA